MPDLFLVNMYFTFLHCIRNIQLIYTTTFFPHTIIRMFFSDIDTFIFKIYYYITFDTDSVFQAML